MLNIPRRLRRRLVSLAIILFFTLNLWYLVLPPDSAVRLAVYFNAARLSNLIREVVADRDAWLRVAAQHHVDLGADVGYLIKTGYGTRHRVAAQLKAFSQAGDILGGEGRGFIVVGDWTTVNATDADLLGASVHDAIRPVMEGQIGQELRGHPRFVKYQSLQEAIDAGDEAKANQLGKDYGWELDALKFIVGMEMMYQALPQKKWYIILDDDTFLVKPSLELFLDRLDSQEPHYIGNAVGDYRGRFAHGGSAVILSGEAMRRLFNRPDIVARSYRASLDETWGDKLVATTLQKVGIYLSERYSHHFNGEPPEITRIAADRYCSPIISFHGLRKAGAMTNVGHTLARLRNPLLWRDVWERFGDYPLQALAWQPIQHGQDHVGPADDNVKVWKGVKNAETCRRKCERLGNKCLAWTYGEQTRLCRGSAWITIGTRAAESEYSGGNWPQIERLMRQCP